MRAEGSRPSKNPEGEGEGEAGLTVEEEAYEGEGEGNWERNTGRYARGSTELKQIFGSVITWPRVDAVVVGEPRITDSA